MIQKFHVRARGSSGRENLWGHSERSRIVLSLAGVHAQLSAFVIPAALILGGIYLGFLERSGKGKKGLQWIKWAFGVIAVALGLFTANALREPGIRWEQFSESKIIDAKSRHKPVLMDFYADCASLASSSSGRRSPMRALSMPHRNSSG